MTLTALLLAGGRSSRMGLDKATLVFEGEPLWKRQVRLLRQLQPEQLFLSIRSSGAWCPPDIEVIVDEAGPHGPLAGVAAGLCLLNTSHLLVLAIDLPRMTPAHLLKLASKASQGCGVVPFNGEFFEPVCAIYPREATDFAAQVIAKKENSMQQFVRRLVEYKLVKPYDLTEDEMPLYWNVNTLEDLKAPLPNS